MNCTTWEEIPRWVFFQQAINLGPTTPLYSHDATQHDDVKRPPGPLVQWLRHLVGIFNLAHWWQKRMNCTSFEMSASQKIEPSSCDGELYCQKVKNRSIWKPGGGQAAESRHKSTRLNSWVLQTFCFSTIYKCCAKERTVNLTTFAISPSWHKQQWGAWEKMEKNQATHCNPTTTTP